MFQHRSTDGRQSGEKGFTLVELLVVIVILGVLAGVVVFAVGGLSEQADENACKTDEKTLKTAIEGYKVKQNDQDAEPTEAQLVAADLLEAESDYYSITYDAQHDPIFTGTGPCA